MKKIIIAIVFLMFGLANFAQYTEDKLPSGLTVSTTANDVDYTIIQKNAESIVKAIRMDSLRSYMTQGMAENIEALDSVAGNTGQFIISDGVGWLAPVSAKYEGSGAYTFGYRDGTVGWGSIVIGGGATGRNTATYPLAMAIGYNSDATEEFAVAIGRNATASGIYSFAAQYGIASGNNAVSFGGMSSGISSVSFAGGEAQGRKSFAFDAEVTHDNAYSFGGYGFANSSFSTNSSTANSYGCISLGQYNDTIAANKTTWVATDPLLYIGNGANGVSRSNALVMLKNGNTTATGDWTIDGDLHVTGMVDAMTLPHMFAYFGDSTITYTFAASDTWYHLTNATDSMWIYSELEDFTVSGDTLIFGVSGDYNLDAHLGYEGGNGTTYSIRYYNVTQGAPIPTAIPNTGRGTGNVISNNIATYAEGIAAGDRVVLQIKADATVDATLKNSTIRIQYLHD